MKHKPTNEQQLIIDACSNLSGINLIEINAGAGTGKTSTLELIADVLKGNCLYLAFNKSMANEAATRFPSNVLCKTTHSLAYAKYGRQYQHKLTRDRGVYTNRNFSPKEIAKRLDVPEIISLKLDELKVIDNDRKTDIIHLNGNVLATFIKDTVTTFEQSSDSYITMTHVIHSILKHKDGKLILSIKDKQRESLINIILGYSENLWSDRCNINNNTLISHDTYLKLYQMSMPLLEQYDTIFLDEAQDTSGCTYEIVKNALLSSNKTNKNVVLVGDKYQNIYSWRGAMNAMKVVHVDDDLKKGSNILSFKLTKSFRFGQEIANVANAIIKDDKFKLVGHNSSCITPYDKSNEEQFKLPNNKITYIDRNNLPLVQKAISLLSQGVKVCIQFDVKDFINVCESILALYESNTRGVYHPDVVQFKTFEELELHIEKDPKFKLAKHVNLLKEKKLQHYLGVLHSYKEPKYTDDAITLITAHKSKGMEWDNVILGPNLLTCKKEDTKVGIASNSILYDVETRNLFYVAATRAKKHLYITNEMDEYIQKNKHMFV